MTSAMFIIYAICSNQNNMTILRTPKILEETNHNWKINELESIGVYNANYI